MDKATIVLHPTPPYDFNLTAGFATFFQGRYGGDIFEDDLFFKLLDVNGHLCVARVHSNGTVARPELEAELTGPVLDRAAINEATRQIAWILGTDQDLTGFYRLIGEDAGLAFMAESMRGLHIPHVVSIYEALVLAISGQQISSHVARVLRTSLIERYGQSIEANGFLYRAFPRPDALEKAGVEGLHALGFSVRKSEYIYEISRRVVSGSLDLEKLRERPDDEVTRELSALKGVGPWTVQWLFIRAFGRTDGFPYGDLALCRVMGQLFNSGTPFTPEQALDYSRRWSPYRSYVTAYLFAAKRSGQAFPSV
jgi:DNA-3-methyladenine glycosylase II